MPVVFVRIRFWQLKLEDHFIVENYSVYEESGPVATSDCSFKCWEWEAEDTELWKGRGEGWFECYMAVVRRVIQDCS